MIIFILMVVLLEVLFDFFPSSRSCQKQKQKRPETGGPAQQLYPLQYILYTLNSVSSEKSGEL